MAYVHDGTETGTGRVIKDGKVVVNPVDYTISYSHRMIPAPSMGNPGAMVRGLGSINGQLNSFFPMSLIGEKIELELEDGRRWSCFIQSSDGNMLNSGGIAAQSPDSEQGAVR